MHDYLQRTVKHEAKSPEDNQTDSCQFTFHQLHDSTTSSAKPRRKWKDAEMRQLRHQRWDVGDVRLFPTTLLTSKTVYAKDQRRKVSPEESLPSR